VELNVEFHIAKLR